jgi:hypothetical protein
MPFYPVMPPDVTPGCAEDAALGLLGQGGVIAVRVADLASPARQGLGKDGRTALTAAGAGRIRSGDLVVWLKPVAVAPAVVRRDGRVQAAGHPADHARLGVVEQRLDELCRVPGVIDQVARSVALDGRVKGAARRAMSPALAIRFTLLMTLVPDADYMEVIETLLGDLVLVPWQRPYRVPTAAAACIWREALGPVPLERLRDMALAGIHGEHRVRDYRAVTVGDLEVGSIDGSLVRVPDTPANRQAFGSAGTADDSSPYPQLRELRISAASTRATFGVATGPSGAGAARDKGEAEQVLLDKALKDYRFLFTPGRLWVMDRNYPGVPRIKAMLAAGTHVLIRVRDGITLRRTAGFLPDGSYLAEISGGGITLTVRVIEYTVTVAGRDAPELFCLITDLRDHDAYPARVLAQAYHWRWIGSETCLKEAKSAISGAGPSTGPMLRSASPALVAQEHAAWVTAVELARAAARAAAAVAVPARRGRRAGQPVHPRQISFTAARRAVVTSVRSGAATASLPAALIEANQDAILAGLARRRVQVDRHRHRDRKTKARQGFPAGGPRLATRTASAEISVCQPLTA